jgi:ADP-heptose:LPS heptosyltransferase
VVWAGSPTYRNDRQRSCHLQDFAPVFKTAGIEFFSLQKGEPSKELTELSPHVAVENLAPVLHGFGDTALLIDQLDLVITVDTAVAHLAGAMAKRVWVLLNYLPDWRWAPEQETSPWYPTMRLFRQEQAGDWSSVMQHVAEALAEWREQLR